MMKSKHIVTIDELAQSKHHQSDVNVALHEIGHKSLHSIHHAVTSYDTVFSGDSGSSFNGTGWVCSTIIFYWDNELGQ